MNLERNNDISSSDVEKIKKNNINYAESKIDALIHSKKLENVGLALTSIKNDTTLHHSDIKRIKSGGKNDTTLHHSDIKRIKSGGIQKDRKLWLKSKQKPDERWIGDQRIFVCLEPDCNSTFNTRFSLKRHGKKHTGERPYMCGFDDCGRRFAEKSTLKRHMRTHTGESPYKCTANNCRKSFNDRIKLRRHMSQHSKEEDELITTKIEQLDHLPDRIKWTHDMIEQKIIKLNDKNTKKRKIAALALSASKIPATVKNGVTTNKKNSLSNINSMVFPTTAGTIPTSTTTSIPTETASNIAPPTTNTIHNNNNNNSNDNDDNNNDNDNYNNNKNGRNAIVNTNVSSSSNDSKVMQNTHELGKRSTKNKKTNNKSQITLIEHFKCPVLNCDKQFKDSVQLDEHIEICEKQKSYPFDPIALLRLAAVCESIG